jgi:hypothetical protein
MGPAFAESCPPKASIDSAIAEAITTDDIFFM